MAVHKVSKDLLCHVYCVKQKQCEEIGKAMDSDYETNPMPRTNEHWQNVEKEQEKLDELLKELGQTDVSAAWYVRKVVELVPLVSVSKFMKILDVCGVEVE